MSQYWGAEVPYPKSSTSTGSKQESNPGPVQRFQKYPNIQSKRYNPKAEKRPRQVKNLQLTEPIRSGAEIRVKNRSGVQ